MQKWTLYVRRPNSSMEWHYVLSNASLKVIAEGAQHLADNGGYEDGIRIERKPK